MNEDLLALFRKTSALLDGHFMPFPRNKYRPKHLPGVGAFRVSTSTDLTRHLITESFPQKRLAALLDAAGEQIGWSVHGSC